MPGSSRNPQDAHQLYVPSVSFSARRVAGRHRQSRQDGEDLGRPDRQRDPYTQGNHRQRQFGLVQPRRVMNVTASSDKTAKVWDARTGAEILTLKGHTMGVRSVSFSPDGSRIVTAKKPDNRRRGSGTPGAASTRPSRPSGHTPGAWFRRRSADGSRVVTAGFGRYGEGLGRREWRPKSSRSRALRRTHLGVVQPRRVAVVTQSTDGTRRRSGTPRPAPGSSRSRPPRRR